MNPRHTYLAVRVAEVIAFVFWVALIVVAIVGLL